MTKNKLKIWKKIKLLVMIALVLTVMAEYSPAEDKVTIVAVNTNTILEQYPPFLEAQAEFQAEHQKMQQRLQEMSEEEQRMGQQMNQQELHQLGPVWSGRQLNPYRKI